MEEFITQVDPAILILLGGLLPLVQAIINRRGWATETKALAAFGVAVIAGVGSALLMGIETRAGIVTTAAAVYALSQLGYFGVWDPVGLADKIEKRTG
jgi:hypothetical protein